MYKVVVFLFSIVTLCMCQYEVTFNGTWVSATNGTVTYTYNVTMLEGGGDHRRPTGETANLYRYLSHEERAILNKAIRDTILGPDPEPTTTDTTDASATEVSNQLEKRSCDTPALYMYADASCQVNEGTLCEGFGLNTCVQWSSVRSFILYTASTKLTLDLFSDDECEISEDLMELPADYSTGCVTFSSAVIQGSEWSST